MQQIDLDLLINVLVALVAALVMSFALTPVVKTFAQKIGAIDNPGEARRVHSHPIPRMGGLAIFLGFILSVILFAEITRPVQGILLGAIIIVVVGAIDDIVSLKASVKFVMQIIAALVAVYHGVLIERIMNPNIFSTAESISLGFFAIPVTVIWIVAITNSVNLIDGLDGLAVGVSAIDSLTMLVIALVVSEGNIAIIMAALAGGCIGFMPYNLNPAKIFMGDTGALLLGYVLASVSVMGLFKFYAVVSFAIPFLVLAVPLFDTVFAFFRRLLRGQNPMAPDRGHFHHRLIDMGLSQKHAVAILYCVSAILGLAAVLLATENTMKAFVLVIAFCIAGGLGAFIMRDKLLAAKASQKASKVQSKDEPPMEVSDEKN